jgi:hypothetical protein
MAALDEFTSEHFGFKLSTGPRGVQVFDALPAAALARPVRLLAIANAAGYFACSDTRCVVVEATAQLRGAADADAAAWRRIAASDVTQVCFSADERRLYVVDGGLVKVVTDFEAGEMRPVGAGAGGVMEIAPSPSGDGFLELRGGADGADGADGDLYLGTTLVALRVLSFAWGVDGSVLYAAEGVVWRARPEGGAGGAERVFGDDDARVVACAELSAGVVLVALGPPDGDVDSQDYEVKVVAGGVAHDAFVADAYGGAGRGAAYYVAAVRDWWHDGHTLAFVTSSKAVEIGSVEVAATGPRSLFHMNDTDKAVLPVTEEGEDVLPVGVAVELGDEVVAEPCLGVEEARGVPRVWSLTDEGRLIGWWVFELTRIGRENCARVGLAAPREEAEVAAPQGEAEVAAPRGEAEVAAPRGEAEVAAPPGEAVAAPSGESGAPAAGAAAPAGAFGSSSFGSSFGGASQFGSSGFGGLLAPKTASGAPKATSLFGSYAKAGSAFSLGSEKSASPFGAVAARESPFGASAGARESPVGTTSPFGSGLFDKESDKAKESPFGTSSFGKESPFGSSLFGAKPAGSKESPFGTSSFGAKPAESKESPFGTSSFGKESPFGTSLFGAKPAESKESPFGTSSFGAKPAESKESPFGTSSFGKESPFGTSSFGAKPAESKESPFGTSSFGKESPFGSSLFGAQPAESKESPFGTSSFGTGSTSGAKESPFGMSLFGAKTAEGDNVKVSPFGRNLFGGKESPFGASSFGAKESPFGPNSGAKEKESPFGSSLFEAKARGDNGAKESPFGTSLFGAASPFGSLASSAKGSPAVEESPFGSFGGNAETTKKPIGSGLFGGVDSKTQSPAAVPANPFGSSDASAFKGAGAKSAFQMGDLGLSDLEASGAEQVSELEASALAASALEASQEELGARPTEEKLEANGEEVELEAGEWEDEEESEVSENEEESETDAAPAQLVPSRATPAKPTATPTSDAADQVPGDSEAQPARTNELLVEVAPPLASRVEEETPGVPPRLSKTTEEVVSPGPEAVDFPPTLSAFAGIEPVPTVRGNAIAQKSVEIYNETGGVLQVLEHNVGALGRYIERMTLRTADAALSEAALDTADVWGLAAGDVVAEISAKYAAAAAQQLATLRSYDARLGALTHELEKSNLTRLRADRLLLQVATIIGDGTSLRARPLDDAHHQLQTGVRQKLHRVQSLQEDIQRAMIPLKARLAGGAVLDNVESCIYNMSEEVFARLGELDALARKVAAVELETVPAARDHGAEAAVRRRWQMAAELLPVQVRVVSL